MQLAKCLNFLADLLFPPLCLSCKSRLSKEERNALVCKNCENQIEITNGFFCPECKRRLWRPQKECHPKIKFVLASVGNYKNKTIRELIHVLKYSGIKDALKPIEKIINRYVDSVFRNSKLEIRNFVIVPIPLHSKKEKERGFNQAFLISEVLLRTLCYSIAPGLKIETNNLIRSKKTESQTEIKDYKERKRNVNKAFSLNKPEAIAGKDIILVDDVFTSGATMEEAVRVLKNAGAKRIIGFVLAKT